MMDASTPPETERLLMSANLHRVRGELNEAETMVRAALERNPDDSFAQEFLGDLLAQKGDYQGAEALYRAVLSKKDAPGRVTVEEKLARLVLRAHPVSVATAAGAPLRTDRNPVSVALLSLLFPGFGHYYLGDRVKGLIFGAVAILLLFAMVPAIVGTAQSVGAAVSTSLDPTGAERVPSAPNLSGAGQIVLWAFMFFCLQMYATYDAYMTARDVYRSD